MIQTQTSSNQKSIPHQTSSLTSNLPDQNNFEYPNDDEEYDDSRDIYHDDDDQDDSEDYPLVWYHLPTKKPDPKQQQLRAESLAKRNQQIQERKKQAKDPYPQALKFLPNLENDHVSIKKINKVRTPFHYVRQTCYISDKNLLVILLHDGKTIKVYNTLNFKLVRAIKIQKEAKCMIYCKELKKIIVAGLCEFIQLWNPKTFEVEAECLQIKCYETFWSVAYVAKSNVVVAKTTYSIYIYNTGLRFMTSLSIPDCRGACGSGAADIFSLSKNLFFMVSPFETQKGVTLFNLKTGKSVDRSKTVFIPWTTCVEMTEKSPINVFSCLGMFNSKPSGKHPDEKYLYPLIQFTIDTKNEELIPVRSSDALKPTFSKLNRAENSKYFLAERFENSSWKTCLLSIEKDKIEILQVFTTPSPINLHKFSTYFMLNDGLTVVEKDERNLIYIYKSIIYRGKSKNMIEQNSP